MKTAFGGALLLCVLIALPVAGQQAIVIGGLDGLDPLDNAEHHPILLALSGGGARGLTTIGILKAFEENGIRVAAVTGTSIGGIIGGLYACGYSPDELASIVRSIDRTGFFSNRPARKSMFLTQRQERDRHLLSIRFDGFRPIIPQALTAGQKLTSVLTTLTTKAGYRSARDFDKLPIPFRTIGTDIVSGREIILDSGSVADAMRAAAAFPLALTPLDKNGQLLMDGGMVTPIPVDLVRSMSDSVTFVVAINTASPLLPKEELKTPVDIANQVTSIMTADKLAAQLKKADYVIEPVIDGIGAADFHLGDSLIEIGYQTGLIAADSIVELLRQNRVSDVSTIVRINLDSCSQPFAKTIESRLLGRTMSKRQLTDTLKSLLAELDLFRIEARAITVCSTSVTDREIRLDITAHPSFARSDTHLEFLGNEVYDDFMLAALLDTGDSLITSWVLRRGLDRILHRYHADGHDLACFRKVEVDPCLRSISVTIDEAIIRGIDIDNNCRTKDWFVKSNFPLRVGEPYSTHRASRGLANIYGTDLFHRVTVDLVPGDSGGVARIGVEEKMYHQLRLGWHWDEVYQSEEFAEFLDDNVLGAGLQYLLHARYSLDRQRYFAAFKADRIFSTYLTARVRAYHERLDRNLYDADGDEIGMREENRTGVEVRFGQQIARLGTVTAGLVLDEMEYKFPREKNRERFGLRILKIESLVETFNRIPFTETGKKHLFELQFAGKYLGGDYEYTRFYSSIEAYWPVGEFLNYHPKLAVGLSRSGLPDSERFYVGGMRSFAGFRTYELVGDKVITMSHEMRFKLPLRFYVTVRCDIGEVYSSADHIKLRGLRYAGGIVVAFDSPIGPFEFGYGIAERNFECYYLNVGLAF